MQDLLGPSEDARLDARWLLLLSLRDQGRLREALALGWEHRIPGSARRVAGVEKDGLITAIMLQDLALADSSAR
ncbi:MAG: hypothetical protein ACRENB_00660, partial [Gemmatimonadales bacterium]